MNEISVGAARRVVDRLVHRREAKIDSLRRTVREALAEIHEHEKMIARLREMAARSPYVLETSPLPFKGW